MPHKILIVDDSPISRKMLKSCLPKDRDFEIMEAGDGLEGVEKYRSFAPDMTFMDLTMPVMDGLEALREILKIDKGAVVVVCTADVQAQAIMRVYETGAAHLVKKPPTKDKILEALTMFDKA